MKTKTLLYLVLALLPLASFAQSELTVWRHPDAEPLPEPAPAGAAEPRAPASVGEAAPATDPVPPPVAMPADLEILKDLETRLVGATPVIDIAHIAETIQVLSNAIQQLERLNRLREKADIDLTTFFKIPFVDPEDETGEFLNTLQVILRGQDPVSREFVEETLAYTSADVSELFRRYFPGERILPGNGSGPSPWDLWESEADYLTERYRAVLAALYRTMDIYAVTLGQNARERQGIKLQRLTAPAADGASQQAQMLLAALHQSLDAQSVDRELDMLRANAELVLAAQEVDDRAASLAKDRAFLAGQAARFAELPLLTEVTGTRIRP